MTRNPGYLSKKKANGSIYIYVRRSYRVGKRTSHKNIYGFGPLPAALEKMYQIRENPNTFPETLSLEGFNLSDLHEWILTIETNITSTGRDFSI
ncbi:hypothetical protein [Bacillus sp. mrc49]|uniref:hypothetical protein n=1 Tax=Bacillus sp. mrc49 TaxID=2054913 RepID=UPI000C26F771|nr:hypothetical protein [Bacillus sp. mrc49]PJN91479.1 hypothetical protein CVN76_04760 [Bacillus sp. mrc49]